MASPNLDLVRTIVAAWERGEFADIGWADPGIEFEIIDGPSPGHWTGVTGMAEGWTGFLAAWEEWRIHPEHFRELGGERVFVLTSARGRGKTSGLDLAQLRAEGANLFHIRAGKVTRLVVYMNRERGLADVGLM